MCTRKFINFLLVLSFPFIFGGFSVTQVKRYDTMFDLKNLTQFYGIISVQSKYKKKTPTALVYTVNVL